MNRTSYLIELCSAAEKFGLTQVLSMFGSGLWVRIPMTRKLWDTSVDELNLTVRSRNGLMRAGTDTIGKVSELIMRDDGLSKVRNLGKKSIAEIKTVLLEEGYRDLDHAGKLRFWREFLDGNQIP